MRSLLMLALLLVSLPAIAEDIDARGFGAVLAASAECHFTLDTEKIRLAVADHEVRRAGFAGEVSTAMHEAAARIEAAPASWRAAHCGDMLAIVAANGFGG